MGTSRALRGPRGPRWDAARRAGEQWYRSGDDADLERFGEACRRALATDLAANPDRFGLRPAMLAAGERLIDVLSQLQREGLPRPTTVDEKWTVHRVLVDAIAGEGTLVTDSAVRRAAARFADRVLDQVESDGPSRTLVGELFCLLYSAFFGDVVAEFLATMAVAPIPLPPGVVALPGLLGGDVTAWISERVRSLVPDPCEAAARPRHRGKSLSALGRELLDVAVRNALGIDGEEGAEAA